MPQPALLACWLDWFWAFTVSYEAATDWRSTELELEDLFEEGADHSASDYVSGFAGAG